MPPLDLAPLTALEPLAGAGLAINLAYLALNRFRYRSQIEPDAEQRCASNDEQKVKGFDDLDAVKELKWLARREKSEVFVPRGRGALVYRFFYRKHQDVILTAGLAGICAFTLAVGVALAVGRWNWAQYLLIKPVPGALFYSCLFALVVPAFLVPLGRKCVAWGKGRIEYCNSQVAITLGNLAEAAKPPEGVAPRPQTGRDMTVATPSPAPMGARVDRVASAVRRNPARDAEMRRQGFIFDPALGRYRRRQPGDPED